MIKVIVDPAKNEDGKIVATRKVVTVFGIQVYKKVILHPISEEGSDEHHFFSNI